MRVPVEEGDAGEPESHVTRVRGCYGSVSGLDAKHLDATVSQRCEAKDCEAREDRTNRMGKAMLRIGWAIPSINRHALRAMIRDGSSGIPGGFSRSAPGPSTAQHNTDAGCVREKRVTGARCRSFRPRRESRFAE
jgi:hypothetical protein